METTASGGEAEEGFEERDWGLSWVLKGRFEHAEGKEEDVLGGRYEGRGLAMRGAVCFQVAGISPA